MQKLEPLRKCRICGLEAHSEADLEKFHKYKSLLFGHENLCKSCQNAMESKGGKYWQAKKRGNEKNNPKNNPRKIRFLGKILIFKENPRINICSECGRKFPETLKRQTAMHHEQYDVSDPLESTNELCTSCHAKLHGLGITIGIGR